MGEEYTVVGGTKIKYNGLFKSRDLLREINEFLSKIGYGKTEKGQEEKVNSHGKKVAISLEYSQSPSDYVKYVIQVDVGISDMKNVVVTKGERKLKYNEGEVEIDIKSKLKTDLAGKWQSNPMNVFAGSVINKYLYPIYLSNDSSEVKKHTMHLIQTVKAFLNLYKF